MLVIAVCVLVFTILCRFVKGPKCLTYCRYKSLKAKQAIDSITINGKLSAILLNNKSTEELINICKAIEHGFCKNTMWNRQITSELKEIIIERQLLGIK